MPTKVFKKINYWSFSRLQEYLTCPFRAYCKMILKLPEPSSPALDNGNHIHLLAESYVSGKVPELSYAEPPRSELTNLALLQAACGKLPDKLKSFKIEFKELRKNKYATEIQWCFTKNWSLTTYDDWDNVWLRIKCDAHNNNIRGSGIFIDYKTGKKYPEKHNEAMELYALAMFIVYPELKTVTSALWYLDIGEETVSTFKVEDVPKMKAKWEKKAAPMLNDGKFIPKPSNFACRYCHFSKTKNGPCEVA